jgi:hypothetical protein
VSKNALNMAKSDDAASVRSSSTDFVWYPNCLVLLFGSDAATLVF